jgi:thiol-disulfide isomerase/thioredoxin
MKNIFCRRILSLVFTLVAATTSFAQNKSVKVGETLPDNFWTTSFPVVNHSQKTLNLSEDKSKLILIDFWNTWCSACLMNIPKITSLQQKFGNKIRILPVSNQDKPALDKFFASQNVKKYNTLTSVYKDSYFHQLFPHAGVPFIKVLEKNNINPQTTKMRTGRNGGTLFIHKHITPSGRFWEYQLMFRDNLQPSPMILISDETKNVLVKSYDTDPTIKSEKKEESYFNLRDSILYPKKDYFILNESQIDEILRKKNYDKASYIVEKYANRTWFIHSDYNKNTQPVMLLLDDISGKILIDINDFSKDLFGEEKFVENFNAILNKRKNLEKEFLLSEGDILKKLVSNFSNQSMKLMAGKKYNRGHDQPDKALTADDMKYETDILQRILKERENALKGMYDKADPYVKIRKERAISISKGYDDHRNPLYIITVDNGNMRGWYFKVDPRTGDLTSIDYLLQEE